MMPSVEERPRVMPSVEERLRVMPSVGEQLAGALVRGRTRSK